MLRLWHVQEIVVSVDNSAPLQEAVPQLSPRRKTMNNLKLIRCEVEIKQFLRASR